MKGTNPGERKMSFGIGGAGNIRTVSEATVHDYYISGEGNERRRSSVWSIPSTPATSRRASIFASVRSMFGSNNTTTVTTKEISDDTTL
ncbi:hypothetical protein NKR23_g4197 [Pleurostoma richardsiae]|uniref:Uncharacterized protein n=1 Tax=Pleurostoma richardsiae TaxID=41990 RepID=A0AA38VFW8_9PEZI|nr:hypothetical protein NKR23_g4197 [Pleurostoma richardsiae]